MNVSSVQASDILVRLRQFVDSKLIQPNQWYAQRADEIHRTKIVQSAITVNIRHRRGHENTASTFAPVHQPWISAKPKVIDSAKVDRLIRDILDGEG